MKKMKRIISLILSATMLTSLLAGLDFSALAAVGDYEPDIQLQFSSFFDADESTDPTEKAASSTTCFESSGLAAFPVQYDAETGTLKATKEDINTYNEYWEADTVDEDWELGVDDIFAVTIRFDNVDIADSGNVNIRYSDNLTPAGLLSYKPGKKTYYKFANENDHPSGFRAELAGFREPVAKFSASTLYEGMNDTLIGDLSCIQEDPAAVDGDGWSDDMMTATLVSSSNRDYIDVSSIDAANGFFNIEDGTYDADNGYTYDGKFIVATFVFQITDEGPIQFTLQDPDGSIDPELKGATFFGKKSEGLEKANATTYAPNGSNPGSKKMTFMGTNENWDGSEAYTVTFLDKNENTISSVKYRAGAAVIIPQLPESSFDESYHYSYAWDNTPSQTATQNATYRVVETKEAHSVVTDEPVAATCTQTGLTEGSRCSVCGAVLTEQEETPLAEHKYRLKSVVSATCTSEGSKTYTCSVCKAQKVETTPALEHSYRLTDTVQPTCTQAGSRTYVCSVCGAEKTEEIPALAHNYEATGTTQPTCTENGSILYTCSVCGDSYSEETPALGHDYKVSEIIAPSCTQAGTKVYTCTRCGDSYSEEGEEALGHNFDITETVAPTCTENGYNVYNCVDCGEEYTEISAYALGHDYQVSKTTEPTCTQAGTMVYTCTRCGSSYSEEYDEPLGHAFELTRTTAPDCTNDGYYIYTCIDCGEEYHERYAYATGHSYEKTSVTDPTPDAQGYTTYTCTVCGDSYESDFTNYPGTGQCGNDAYYRFNYENGVLEIFGSGDMYGTAQFYNTSLGSMIKTVVVYEGITSVGSYAFVECPALTNIALADSVTRIGDLAFFGCRGLTSVTIPNGVKAINVQTFSYCTGLKEIVIPDSVTTIVDMAFDGCTGLCDVYYTGSEAQWQSISIGSSNECLTNAAIHYNYSPACKEHTPADAVRENEIPATCTENGSYDEVVYCSVCGEELSRETKTVDASGHNYEAVVTAPTVTSQGYTTYTCTVCGFSYAADYTSYPVTGQCGENAYYYFNSENGVLEIFGSGDMYDYKFDTDTPFFNDKNIKEIVIYDGITKIGKCAFCYCGATGVEIPDSVTEIGSYCFCECTSLTEIEIPDSVTIIGESSFSRCSSLTNLEIPSGVTKISDLLFEACTGLTSIVIPNSVTDIGESAFAYCRSLTSVIIPNSVTSIGKWAFVSCTGLSRIEIPDSVTRIEEFAFVDCTGLTGIVIPNSVTRIGYGAFEDCIALTDVYYTGSEAQWQSISIGSSNECLTNATIHYNYVPACTEHTPADAVRENEIPATCTENGSYDEVVYCSVCGEELSRETKTVDASGHNYEAVVTAPTCTEEGCTTYTCTACGDTYVTDCVEPIGHNCNAVVTYPTVTSQGYTTYTCTVCGDSYIADFTDPVPTGMCGENISYSFDAQTGFLHLSGSGDMQNYSITRHSPFYNCPDIKYLKVDDGITSIGKYAFSGCHEIFRVLLPESCVSIMMYAFSSLSADCFVVYTGSEEQWSGIYFQKGNSKLQHPFIIYYNYMSEGDFCYQISEENTAIIVSYFGGAANITIPDTIGGYAASSIGEYAFYGCEYLSGAVIPNGVEIIDELAFYDCSSLTSVEVPGSVTSIGECAFEDCIALTDVYYTGSEAEWQSISIESSNECLTNATIHYNYVPACTEHTPADAVRENEIPATCTENGSYDEVVYCSVCGEELSREAKTIPSSGAHSVVLDFSIEPTCTQKGLNAYICSVCSESYSEITDETDHTAVVDAAVEPTCTQTGLTEGSHCSVCGEIIVAQNEIPKTAHSVVVDPAVEPTCTEAGLTEGSHCSVCGEIIVEQNIVPALPHSYRYTRIAPNCTEGGVIIYTCSVCSDSYYEVLPATGHRAVVDKGYAATCTEAGLTDGSHCSVCGEVITEHQEIPAAGHTVVVDESSDATCTDDGLTEGSHCSVCGEVIEAQRKIPATGHSYEAVVTAPTKDKQGYTTYTCTVCGDSYISDYTDYHYTKQIGNNVFFDINCTTGEVLITGSGDMYNYTGSGTLSLIPYRNYIKSVVIEDGVTSIGNGAFYEAKSLTEVSIPESVTAIYLAAFQYCEALSEITLPSGLKTIGDGAFSHCRSLTELSIPKGVTTIGAKAFASCTKLESIEVDSENTVFDSRESCNAIIKTSTNTLIAGCKNTVIPVSVAEIGSDAFLGCSGLTDIVIPKNVTRIISSAFSGCGNLTSVTIPRRTVLIDNGAFENCNSLRDVYYLGSEADWNNISIGSDNACLTRAAVHYNTPFVCDEHLPGEAVHENIIPASCTENGSYDEVVYCEYCAAELSRETVTVEALGHSYEASVTQATEDSIGYITYTCTRCGYSYVSEYTLYGVSGKCGDNAFYELNPETGELRIFGSGDIYDYMASDNYETGVTTITTPFHSIDGIKSVVIEEGITRIGHYLFTECKDLKSVSIPSTVTSIGWVVFGLCTSLDSIVVAEGNPVYDSRENCNAVIETATNTLITGCSGTVIPYGITEIGDEALAGTGIRSITIPETVTTIGIYAFSNCYYLKSITIPDSVTEIGSGCFYKCTSLKSAVIGNGITELNDTFSDCPSLESVVLPDTLELIDICVFANCSSLKSITIPNGVKGIYEDAFNDCSSLTEIEIPDSVTYLGYGCFSGCTGLTRVVIPDTVKSLGPHCFDGCTNLRSAVIGNGVTGDCYHVFDGCTSLTEARLGSGITRLSSTFAGCTSLKRLEISENIKYLSDFKGCTALTDIYYGGSEEDWNNVGYYNEPVIENATIHFNYIAPCEVHTWNSGTYSPAPTCTESGTVVYTCTVCGVTCSEEVSALGHSYNEERYEPTCTDSGISVYTCSVCNSTYYEILPATGHTAVTDEAVAPTMTENGLTEGSHCRVCGAVIVPQEVVETQWKKCGENAYYYFDSESATVTVSGTGEMFDYESLPDSTPNNQITDSPFYSIRSSIKRVVIENGITKIGNYSFTSCNEILSVEIPGSVKTVGDSAFHSCKKLESLVIPEGVEVIGRSAFIFCIALKNLSLPGSLRTLEYASFAYSQIETLNLPEGLETIGYGAFKYCTKLKSVSIPESVTSIEALAFSDCPALESINIPENIDTIEIGVFEHCNSLRITSIPEHITEIKDIAFNGCLISSIYIPATLTSIGNKALCSYDEIKSIAVDKNNPVYDSRNNCNAIIETATDTLIFACNNSVIPDGIKIIGEDAFYDGWLMEELYIPASVKEIKKGAFEYCENLKDVNFCGSESEWTQVVIGEKNDYLTNANIHYNCVPPCEVHTWNGGEYSTAPTCTESGTAVYTCVVCGVTHSEEAPAFGHSYSVSTRIEPTCTSDGICVYTCIRCRNTYYEALPATGHTVVIDEAVEPAAGRDGLTEGSHCSVCGEILVPQEIIPAIDGLPTATVSDITETEENSIGLDIAYKFEANNDGVNYNNYKADFVITVDRNLTASEGELWGKFGSYEWTKLEAGEVEGNREYFLLRDVFEWDLTYKDVCDIISTFLCGIRGEANEATNLNVKLVIYEAGSEEYITINEFDYVIPKHIHTFSKTGSDATCTEDGAFVYTCTSCAESYSEVIPAKGHSLGSWVITSYPTCINMGLSMRFCGNCDYSESKALGKAAHTPEPAEAVAPTCYSTGLTEGTVCSVCGAAISGREAVAKTDHSYELIASNSREATCTETGMNYYKCSVCGESYTSTLAILPHQYEITEKVESTPNERGYEIFTCSNCSTFYKEYLPYASDNSALIAVLLKATLFGRSDFSSDSYEAFQSIYDACDVISNKDSSQSDIDAAISQIMTAINSLVPYANISVEAENGSVTLSYDGETYTESSYSILYGTPITMSAVADEGYEFAGWYETTTNRLFSSNADYTFYATSNMSFRAVFVEESAATLSFENESGWVASTVSKKVSQWSEITTIEDMLPEVPYRLGYENGRWVYDEAEVLSKLRNGEDVVITPEYDESVQQDIIPEEPATSDEPTLRMNYIYNPYYDIGSFVVKTNVPEGCRVNSVGVAFYYDKKHKFNPNDMYLTLNNKTLVSQFHEIDDNGVYIVDVRHFSHYSWAAVGYITYFDANGSLKTAYSQQINIIDNMQVIQ